MNEKIYKPLIGGLYWWIVIPTSALMLGVTVGLAVSYLPSLFFMIPLCLLEAYFFVSPLFGYVELRSECVFVRFGFFLKKEIPYGKIRGVSKKRRYYADSTVSLKCAAEHVNINYNRFDVTTVSVKDNDDLMEQIERRIHS